METRKFLFKFYIIVNIVAFIFYSLGYINSKPINGSENISILFYIINIILLISSLYIILKIFTLMEKNITINPLKYNLENTNFIGLIILLIQIVYLYTFLTQGGSVAGEKDNLGGGIFGLVMATFQIQTLSLLYIISKEKTGYICKAILFLFLLTSILQGWTSWILTFAVLYLFIQEDKGKIKSFFKVSVIAMVLLIIFYPIIYFLRLTIRIMGTQEVSFEEIELIQTYGNNNLIDFVLYTYNKVLERFEQYYLSLGSLIHHDKIATAYNNGEITPFYFEGVGKIFIHETYSMGNYLPSLFYNDALLGEYFWNISPGFISLFYTESLSILFILPYYIFLILLIIMILKLIKAPSLAYHFVFFNLITLLFTGWFSQFSYFVWTFIILFILVQTVGFIKHMLISISKQGKLI